MSEPVPGFLVTIRSQPKHGLLYAAVQRHGGGRQLKTATGISYPSLCKWVNLRGYPTSAFSDNGRYYIQGRRERIDAALQKEVGCTIDECWPPEVRTFIDNAKELKSLVFEQTREVPLARLTGQDMLQLTVDGEVSDVAEQRELQERMKQVLTKLSFREREIIKLRYGLGGGATFTLKETAHAFKTSREYIRQIQAKAIRKLQDYPLSGKLVGFCD